MQKNLLHINIQQNKIEIIFLHFCLHNTENLVLTNTDIVFRSVKIYGKSMKFTKFRISNSALLLRHCAGSPRDPRNLPRSMEVSGNFKRVQFTFQRRGEGKPVQPPSRNLLTNIESRHCAYPYRFLSAPICLPDKCLYFKWLFPPQKCF